MNHSERYKGAIALIKSQTNYSEEESAEKLEKWEGNYMNVIKEYLNPTFQQKKPEKERSINEQMMSEIRNFWDVANSQFLHRKEEAKKKQDYLKKVYTEFLKKKEEFPNCKYNPPTCKSCIASCKNPMCPGFLNKEEKYEKK